MKKKYFDFRFIEKENIAEYKKINQFISDNYPDNKERTYQIGFETFGILIIGICKWIHQKNKNDENNELIFLARDGYILEKAYNILFPKEKTKYMYVSRRSLSLPSIYLAQTIEEIFNCLVLPPIFNINAFLHSMNLRSEDYFDVIESTGIGLNEIFKRNQFKNNPKLISFTKNIESDIRENAKKQYLFFKEYLEQINFKKNVGIVDIGWHNSIQLNLMKLINNDTRINGYYVGVYDDAKIIKKPSFSSGFLYEYGNNIKRQYRTFSFVSLFESMFLSQEGTTVGYDVNDGKVIPVKREYEYSNNTLLKDIIRNFQNGALDFIKKYKNELIDNLKLTPDVCSANLLSFGSNPDKKDLSIFEKLSFENYEVNNIVNFKNNSLYYFFHPKLMVKDFYQSGWRIIFLKKLLKVKLPYNLIFDFICKYLKKGA